MVARPFLARSPRAIVYRPLNFKDGTCDVLYKEKPCKHAASRTGSNYGDIRWCFDMNLEMSNERMRRFSRNRRRHLYGD